MDREEGRGRVVAKEPAPPMGGSVERVDRTVPQPARDPNERPEQTASLVATKPPAATKRTPERDLDADAKNRNAERSAEPNTGKAPNRTEPTNVVPMPTPNAREATRSNAPSATALRNTAQAERSALVERLETALNERYLIKRALVKVADVPIGHTEYRFRGDTSRVAFTESAFRLATETNSPSVARSMVDVAEARNWKALRISGNEDFKRMVWLEASVRGVKALGHEPNPGDLELLRREREARLVNRIEPARDAGTGTAAGAVTDKASGRGGGGRKAVLAAIEAVLVAKGVPEQKRTAVMAAATEKLAQRMRDGQMPKVRVYDKAAPSQRQLMLPTPEQQHTRDRATPAPVR